MTGHRFNNPDFGHFMLKLTFPELLALDDVDLPA
jgi:hypothetical protein